MATRTVTALFDRYDDAAEAVRQLEAAGIAHADISIISNDEAHARFHGGVPGVDLPTADRHVSGTGTGASLGTLLGGGAGLLAGLGLLAIPGLGPVVAAGWLASALVGAGVGAAAGGLVGSLTEEGLSESDAEAYADGLHRGGTLVTARVAGMLIEPATEILGRHGTVDLSLRVPVWQGGATAGDAGPAPEIPAVGDPALAEAGLVPTPDPETDEPTPLPNLARPGSRVAGPGGPKDTAGAIGRATRGSVRVDEP